MGYSFLGPTGEEDYASGLISPAEVPALAGEAYGPAARAVDAQGNVTQMGQMVPDPQTGLLEPQYNDPDFIGWRPDTPEVDPALAAGAPPVTQPVQRAQWLDQQDLTQITQQFDQQLAILRAPVQQALDTSQQQYRVDFDAVSNANIPMEQKEAQLQRLNATYQKKWIGMKGKIASGEQTLEQQRQQVTMQATMQHALRMQQIKAYSELEESGDLSPERARVLQARALGVELPVTAFDKPRSQNPLDQAKDLQNLTSDIDRYLSINYELSPKTGELRVRKPQWEWANPDEFDPKTDVVSATDAQRVEYSSLVLEKQQALAQRHQLINQSLGIKAADIQSHASKLAQGVSAAKPKSRTGLSGWNLFPGYSVARTISLRRQAASARKRDAARATVPTEAELRHQDTSESYWQGVELGYW